MWRWRSSEAVVLVAAVVVVDAAVVVAVVVAGTLVLLRNGVGFGWKLLNRRECVATSGKRFGLRNMYLGPSRDSMRPVGLLWFYAFSRIA